MLAILRDDAITSYLRQHNSESENVRGFIESALKGFRGQIMTVALAINMRRGRPPASQTKVANLEDTLEIYEDVGRLHVKVDEPALMDELETLSFD